MTETVEEYSFWKRNHDGTVVIIDHVQPYPNTFHRLVYWRRVDNNRRGTIWEDDFLRRYKPTSNPRQT